MRLVEAEALKAAVREKFESLSMRCEVNEIINAAPSIDAIPVERILDLLQQADDSGGMYLFVAEGIRFVLAMWEEEQGARA